jgi:hypothetical protein
MPDFKLPTFAQIAGHSLLLDTDPPSDFSDWGEYHHDSKKIVIGEKAMASERQALDTIRHELVHAAMHLAGVSYNESHEEEAIVRCIESIFFPAWDRFTEEYEKLNKTRK